MTWIQYINVSLYVDYLCNTKITLVTYYVLLYYEDTLFINSNLIIIYMSMCRCSSNKCTHFFQ